MRILVIEDDLPLSNFLKKRLEAESHFVDTAGDGESAFTAATANDYDLVILDLNLPHLDGIGCLKKLRPIKPNLPVLVLTARNKVEDRIQALDCGADDCLNKPFSYSELEARVRALLRRNPDAPRSVLTVGDLSLDCIEKRVERVGRRIDLSMKEFALLEYLMRNARRPVTRPMIMEHVWNVAFNEDNNVVDVYIKYLRDKVDAGFDNKLIRTVRGLGYVVTDR